MQIRLYRPLRRAISAFEDLVFPPMCAGCHERGRWLCDACRRDLKVVARPICARCGQPGDEASNVCSHCSAWPAQIGAVRGAFEFGGPLRDAIHRYKYQSEYARAPSLSALLVEALERSEFQANTSWDLIAYVPLHARRRRIRGFDQSRLLARGLADRVGLSCTSDLLRLVDTPTQVGRGAAERQLNVRDAFDWKGGPLNGSRILIIDDVITTGATMIAASMPLIRAGADRVDGLAVAREVVRPLSAYP